MSDQSEHSTPRRAGSVTRRLVLGGAAATVGAMASVARGVVPAAAASEPILNGEINLVRTQTSLVNPGSGAPGSDGAGQSLDVVDPLLIVDNSASTRSTAAGATVIGRRRGMNVATSEGGTALDVRAGTVAGTGVSAVAPGPDGVGVLASGAAFGIRAGGGATAGEFIGASYGVVASGSRPLVFGAGHGSLGVPVTPGQRGEFAFDLEGNVYLCVADGTPGTWRKLAGPASAGSFHLLAEPRRVYDSRPGNAPLGPSNGGPKGIMVDGEVRIVDAKANGAPVPTDATGILFNLAVTETNAAGFLTAWSAGPPPLASAMNWSREGTTLSNSVTIALGPGATFSLLCGGGGVAHVIVDVAGYYR